MCVGRSWLKTHEHESNEELERVDKESLFKFGDNMYKTEEYVKMPLKIGNSLRDEVEVAVVLANVPLLLSRDKLKEWGAILDFNKSALF